LLTTMLLFTVDLAIALNERTDAIVNTATDVKVFMILYPSYLEELCFS